MKAIALLATLGAVLAASIASGPAVAQSQPASTLPGGASSLQETYQDWSVSCVQQGAGKRCVLTQVQNQQNGQRVLAIELNAPAGNKVTGSAILPFGLALASGVILQVDDEAASAPSLAFRTCLPGGCIVPLSFDAPAIVALRAGAALQLKAVSDDGREIPFSISLKGFSTALDRVNTLSR